MKRMHILGLVCVAAVAWGTVCAQENARPDLKVKTKSNVKNDRAAQTGAAGTATPAAQGIAVDHAGGNGVRRADTPAAGTGAQPAEKPKATPPKKHLGNVKYNDRTAPAPAPTPAPVDAAKIKSHSNSTNNRTAQPATAATAGTAGSPKPQ